MISDVLVDRDLPGVELQAARLDGELFPLGPAYCLLDVIETPAHRARALLAGRSPRFVVALESAAWVWGAGAAPTPPTFAVAPEARAQVKGGAPAIVRELVLPAEDVARWPGAAVTTPTRTLFDLARDDAGDRLLRALLGAPGVTRDAVEATLRRHRRTPGSRRASERLRELLDRVYAVETR